MSVDLKSLFPATPALRSVFRPEDRAAETLARHLPWLSAPADNLILTRQGDLIASAVVEGQDSFTTEEGDLSLATTSLARLIGQLGEGFGFHVSKLTLPDAPQLKPFDGEGSGEAFAAMVDDGWQGHLRARTLKRRVLVVSLILRPTALKRAPLIGTLFKAAFTGDLGQRVERLNEAMGLLAGACQGLGFRRLTISSGEWLGLLGVLLGQPMAKVLPMRGQFLSEAIASSQMTFSGKRVEIETGAGQRFGTIFGVKSYPARTWARMLDALELPYDIVITNSFTPARNNEIEERIKRTARQMRASEDAAETLRQELYEAADNVASGRQVFGKHHLTVMVTAETPEQLEEAASEVWRAGQDCGATLVRESFAARETQVFTVLVDRQTGDAENILQVAPTGIEDQEALKQSLLVAYVSDREGYFLAGIQARLESVQRRSTGSAEESLRLLWSKGGGNSAYPPDVYGPGAEVTVTVRRITFLSPNVAQIRFLKTLRKTKQEPVTQPFVATVEFAFEPKTERSLAHVWENPLGFTVSAYRVDAETLETNP